MITFREFVLLREAGLMSINPPAGGLSKFTPFPTTAGHIQRMRTLAKPPVARPTPLVVPKLKP
jgi:hypothetical protein